MQLFCLTAGSVLTTVMVILMISGKKYEYMLKPLEGDAFPLRSIYTVGLALQGQKKRNVYDSMAQGVRSDTIVLYSALFEEFYAKIVVAQILSVGLLCLCMGFSVGGMIGGEMGTFIALLGVIFCIISCYYFKTYTRNKVKARSDECESELPNAIAKLALMVNSGVILHDAWKLTADGDQGEFYRLMRKSCSEMENGKSDIEAIRQFGVETNSNEIKKFCTALIQNIERGGGELPIFLVNQSTEFWQLKRQKSLQKGEKAASALLIPIAMMFAGIILIVLASVIQSLSSGF